MNHANSALRLPPPIEVLDKGTILDIAVPRLNSELDRLVLPGSAIVCLPKDDIETEGIALVHYEGNTIGADNLHQMTGRLASAAGRLIARYPTSARLRVREADLIRVGKYQLSSNRIIIERADLYQSWVRMYQPR